MPQIDLYDFTAPAVSPKETTEEDVLTELDRASKRALSEAEELAKSASGLKVTFDRLVDSVDKSLALVREVSESLSRMDADIKQLMRECRGLRFHRRL